MAARAATKKIGSAQRPPSLLRSFLKGRWRYRERFTPFFFEREALTMLMKRA